MGQILSHLTRGDKLLLVTLVIVGLLGIGIGAMGKTLYLGSHHEKVLMIEVDGKPFERVNLSPEGGLQVIEVPLDGGNAYIEIEDGIRARIRPMPDHLCPLKVCSRRGWIEAPGEIIVCVPNRLVVRFITMDRPSSQGAKDGLDAVTY